MITRLFTGLLILLWSHSVKGQDQSDVSSKKNDMRYGNWYPTISLFYGPSYRSDRTILHSFDLDAQRIAPLFNRRRWYAFRVRMDYVNGDNYAVGLGFQTRMFRTTSKWPIKRLLIIGLVPSVFSIDKSYGVNIKPEFGVRFSMFGWSHVGATVYFGYAFEIPVVGMDQYFAGRHDLTLKIALSFLHVGDRRRFRNENPEDG